MTIRIATFNAENLFRRPVVFGIEDAAKRRGVLDAFNRLIELLDHPEYTREDKTEILQILAAHGVDSDQATSTRAIAVNEPRGGARLLKTEDGVVHVRAKGRPHWVGWAELVRDDLSLEGVRNTARVIAEVDADLLLTVEIEDRLTLHRFNEQVLGGQLGARPYPFNLLIDGNDSRGIDVGVLSRHPITSVRSHIFDTKEGDPVFSRDCPEFEVDFGRGVHLWLLGNHFKSKIGNPAVTLRQRKRQAERVAAMYRAALDRCARVVVAGDLNDTLDSEPLAFLLTAGLRDAMTHPSYTGDPGTHGDGESPGDKLDYLMFSPELWDTVQAVDVERRGIFTPGKCFDTVTSKGNQASDHAALFADLAL